MVGFDVVGGRLRTGGGRRARPLPLLMLLGISVSLVLVGCSAGSVTPSPASPEPSMAVSTTGTATVTTPVPHSSGDNCAGPGLSTGPAAPLVTVQVTAPATARSGASVSVQSRLLVRSDGPRVVLQPATSALVVMKDGAVVARTAGANGPAVPLQLRAGEQRPAQTVPDVLTLVGCDGVRLPAGTYAVQAIVGYGEDPLNAGADGGGPGSFRLVSPSQALTIT